MAGDEAFGQTAKKADVWGQGKGRLEVSLSAASPVVGELLRLKCHRASESRRSRLACGVGRQKACPFSLEVVVLGCRAQAVGLVEEPDSLWGWRLAAGSFTLRDAYTPHSLASRPLGALSYLFQTEPVQKSLADSVL